MSARAGGPLERGFFFFFNDTATTEIYTLSLHDALPIYRIEHSEKLRARQTAEILAARLRPAEGDRKSTRLNSSHLVISYAVFCLKKKIEFSEDRLEFVIVKELHKTSGDRGSNGVGLPHD